MPSPAVSEAEFLRLWGVHGNATSMAQALNTTERAINGRRNRLRSKGHDLPTRAMPGYETRVPVQNKPGWTFPRENPQDIHTGSVVVFSDAHFWPGEPSVAFTALIAAIKVVKPRAVIANGDVFDGGSIGRHPPFGWCERPTVKQELEACQEFMGEIEQAVPRGCNLLYNIGNHDVRFERALAMQASDFVGLDGFRLSDQFPAWDMQWSTPINWESAHPVMVKHRNAGGIHAGYNNTMKGGVTIVTGHTHILECKPWGDYRGRRWGVQTGTLADLHGPQFEYHENGPTPACSGFVVLTFKDGHLAPPELCEVIDGRAWFRGEVIA